MILEHEGTLKFVACVIEGGGFKAAMVRSVLAGMRLLAPSRVRVIANHFGTTALAAKEIARHVPIGSENAFVSSIEDLRSILAHRSLDGFSAG